MLRKMIINLFAGGLFMVFAVGESYAQVTSRTDWSLKYVALMVFGKGTVCDI
jgi:hypothetical protein